jgi:hypothetical protein
MHVPVGETLVLQWDAGTMTLMMLFSGSLMILMTARSSTNYAS